MNQRMPVTALIPLAGGRDPVPTIDRITITVAVSDGSAITLDIPKPLGAGLDYESGSDTGPCIRHGNLVAPYSPRTSAYCLDCDGRQTLTLAVELNPWRDDHEPAYTVTTQQAPERGSP